MLKKRIFAVLAISFVAIASVAAYLYLQTQVYYPVVGLALPDGLSITAVLPQAKERKACDLANGRFIGPFTQSCKECKVSMARCERKLGGLELAMRDGGPVPYPMVVAGEVRLAVMGPPEKAKAGCKVLAANIAAGGVKDAACVQPQASPPQN